MVQYFTKDTFDGYGKKVKAVWEYDDKWELKDPGKTFDEKIIPKINELKTRIWGEKILGCLNYIELNYNYERIIFLTIWVHPCEGFWWGSSFPNFVQYRLSRWAGKDIELYKDEPPIKPFRFVCYSYNSGAHGYYLPATAEAVLSRDFKEFPPTKEELALWRSLRKTKTPARAKMSDKIRFLVEYAKRINSHNTIKVDEFRYLTL